MDKELAQEKNLYVEEVINKARKAMDSIEHYDQKTVDKLCQAVGWAISNETTFTRLARMGVKESGIGDIEGRPAKRFKVHGVLRDCLRQKSVGIVEEIPERGIVKYAKPAGVIVSLVPVTNPVMTPATTAIFAIKAKDAVIFCPHPRALQTIRQTVEVLRQALADQGAPSDLFQCVEKPSFSLTDALMAEADLVMATGGANMVKAAYSSGTPAFGVGPGNATMVVDETADVDVAAHYVKISKMNDNGSGCSADGNVLVSSAIYEEFLEALESEGGYVASDNEKRQLATAMWDEVGRRTIDTVACPASRIAEKAGFNLPRDKQFIIVQQQEIGPEHPFCREKLSPVLAIYKFANFEEALDMVQGIFQVGGRGHSCSIYSHNEEHIHRLALTAPVSRIMVRQPTSLANSGSFTNGMPMTASLGCGFWGNNITNENIHLKHYLNFTWVSRPIPEDRPTEKELFGEFYGSKTY
ncbi:MAG: aldehyde dehydrogenase family protein [Deltaproteobacteria bacterium]|nr:aldehyde dehydrogenase family protein [Deltaproteobacteria bacterium]MBW1931170.1 aldehyde dehydrogenase family protein [Deltaproteobacteria bacterium]MBW2025910.1 aldehyde dehydrogenase family protein [Deltaproteobacteria bacterium]MBW2125911.1 aldehyde dehydrogenase family protein [Deltaproteobacteria bacterium]